MSYNEWKDSLKGKYTIKKEIRSGTKELFDSILKKENNLVPRILSLVFSVMSLSSCISQLVVAYKWIFTLPGLSIILFIKELFGFLIILKSSINILLKKPSKGIFDGINNPFDKENGLLNGVLDPITFQKFRGIFYVFGSLSNAKAFLTCLISAKYGVTLPLLGTESSLQKLGNIMVLTIDLVIKTKDESSEVNFWLFKNLLQNIVLFCIAQISLINNLMQVSDFVKDIEENQITSNSLKLGIEGIYNIINGEKNSEKLIENFPKNELEEIIKEEEEEENNNNKIKKK